MQACIPCFEQVLTDPLQLPSSTGFGTVVSVLSFSLPPSIPLPFLSAGGGSGMGAPKLFVSFSGLLDILGSTGNGTLVLLV